MYNFYMNRFFTPYATEINKEGWKEGFGDSSKFTNTPLVAVTRL